MLGSKENNKAIKTLNDKLLETKNDIGVIASFLLSPLSKITNPENTTQLKLVKYSKSNRVNDFLIQSITSHFRKQFVIISCYK